MSTAHTKYLGAALALAIMMGGVAGCHKKDDTVGAPGPAEQAGRRLDQVTDKAGRDLTKAADQANQQIQDAAKETREQVDKAPMPPAKSWRRRVRNCRKRPTRINKREPALAAPAAGGNQSAAIKQPRSTSRDPQVAYGKPYSICCAWSWAVAP